MGGKYLKARQLAKEMEKKAKDAAKKKKEAKKKLDRVDELLEISENLDLDIEEARSLIEEGNERLDDKEFDKANSLFDEAIDKMRNMNLEKIDDKLNDIEDFLKTAGDNEQYESLKDEMEEAKKLVQENKFTEAHKKSKDIKNKADEIIKDGINSDLEEIESMMDLMEGWDGDKSEAEEMYSKAKEAYEDDDYNRAAELINDCKRVLENKIKEDLVGMIEELEKEKGQLKSEDVEIEEISKKLDEAEQLRKEEEYHEAVDVIQETSGLIEKEVKNLVKNKLDVFEEHLEEAKDIGADIGDLDGALNKIKQFLEEGELSKANDLLDESFEKVEDAKFQKVLKTIAESREDFIQAKEIGADISEPMELLNKARDSLKGGDYRAALKWAKAGREKVKELVKQHKDIQNTINEKDEYIDRLSELIDINFVESRNILSESEELLDENRYEEAGDKIEVLNEKIDKTAYEGLMEIIEDFEVTLLTAEDIDIDVGDYNSKLDESIERTKSNDFLEAAKIALESKEDLHETIEMELSDRIEKMEEKTSKVSGRIDDDVEDRVRRFLEESRNSFENKSYRDSWEFITKAEKELEMTQKAKAEEYLGKASDLIKIVKDLEVEGINIKNLQENIDDAEVLLEKGDFPESTEKSDSVVRKLNSKLDKKADELFSEAKKEVLKAKKAGINIEDSREQLIKCKKKIKKKEYAEAIRIAYDIRENNKNERQRRRSINEYIANVTNKISEIKDKEKTADISNVREILKDAKKEVEDENYSEAKRLAEDARNRIDEIKGREAIKNKIEEVSGQVERLEETIIESKEIERLEKEIEDAEDLVESGENKKALDRVENIQEEINQHVKRSIEDKIEQIEEKLDSVGGVGIDFSETEDLLDEAKSLFEDDWYWEAHSKLLESENKFEDKRQKSKNAREKLKEVKEMIENARAINTDVREPKSIIEKVETAIDQNDYEYAIEELELAERKIRNSEKKRVKNILNTFRQKIEKARSKGLDIALADNILRRAEKAMDDGDYREAINLAMQSEGEIEKIELQQKIAKRTILNANKKLKRAEEKGINLDRARMLINNSKRSYREGIYVKAFDSALKASDELNRILKAFNECEENIQKIERMIDEFKEEGIEVESLKEDLKEIEEELNSDKYEEAYGLSDELINDNERFEPLISELSSKVEEKLDELEEKGRDINKARKKIAKTRAVMDVESPYYLLELIDEAREESGIKKEEKYHELVEEVEGLIKKAQKFGASVRSVKDNVKRAKEFYSENDIEGAYDMVVKAQDKVEEALEPYSPDLEIEINKRPIINEWNVFHLDVKNNGGGVAKGLDVEIDGAEIKELDLPKVVKANDEVDIRFKIKPFEEKITVRFEGRRIFDDKRSADKASIDVSEGFEYTTSEDEETCDICGETIEKGTEMIKCSCGNTMHKECAQEEKVCHNCNTNLEEVEDVEEKKKVSRRVSLGI